MDLNIYNFLISQNISADLQGPKEKYKLHYGQVHILSVTVGIFCDENYM